MTNEVPLLSLLVGFRDLGLFQIRLRDQGPFEGFRDFLPHWARDLVTFSFRDLLAFSFSRDINKCFHISGFRVLGLMIPHEEALY